MTLNTKNKINWIKCSEQMPKSGAKILVLTNYNEHFVAYISIGDGFELNSPMYLDARYSKIDGVTHWAELDWPDGY